MKSTKVQRPVLVKRLKAVVLSFFLAGLLLTLGTPSQAQQWIKLTPGSGPPNTRQNSSAVYDPNTNQMIVFGGLTVVVNPGFSSNILLNDVWRLTNANGIGASEWTPVAPGGGSPAPRARHKAVYDPGSDRMIIFGGLVNLGFPSTCTNEVWVLANASGVGGTPTWTILNVPGAAPAPRANHSAVYNPTSNQLIVFGGDDCVQTSFNDVWVLSNANGLGGTPTWTQVAPAGVLPVARNGHSAIYDPASNRMVVFGGDTDLFPLPPFLYDVWVLTNANGLGGVPTWMQLTLSGTFPTPRENHSAIYDAVSNRMIIFGGRTTANLSSFVDMDANDVWVLSNANGLGGTPTWIENAPGGVLPTPRNDHSAIYDPASNRMAVFGGGTSFRPLNDVWVLTNANTVTLPPRPIARLKLQSQPGDYIGQGGNFDITYTPDSPGRFSAQILNTVDPSPGSPALLVFSGGVVTSGPDNTNALLFFGTDKLGIPLQTGFFPDVERAVFASPGHPGLDVGFQNRGCNILTGSFTINDISFSPEQRLETFSATFEQHCEGANSALLGSFEYNAGSFSPPPTQPPPPTPAPDPPPPTPTPDPPPPTTISPNPDSRQTGGGGCAMISPKDGDPQSEKTADIPVLLTVILILLKRKGIRRRAFRTDECRDHLNPLV